MYAVFHAILCVWNLNFLTPAISDWIYSVFCNSRCLKLNFSCCCIYRMDLSLPSCHSMCVKLNFAHTYSLGLDVFRFPCRSKCLKLNFVRNLNLRTDVFPLTCIFRCVLYFLSIFSVRLDVFLLLLAMLGLPTV